TDGYAQRIGPPFQFHRHPHAAPKHRLQIAVHKAMIAERLWIALTPPSTGSKVRHLARWLHVALLTLRSLLPGGAGEPFRIGRVHGDAQDDALMTRGTVTALLVQR